MAPRFMDASLVRAMRLRKKPGYAEYGDTIARLLDGKLPPALHRPVVAALKRHAAADADCARLLEEITKASRQR